MGGGAGNSSATATAAAAASAAAAATAMNTASGGSGGLGRERAIETLIDRDPHGDLYRAARVVDEAVPLANASRPNFVSRTALVEQAFALSKYDIDTVAKYDDAYQISTGCNNTEAADDSLFQKKRRQRQQFSKQTKKIDALTKERIFHYQAKLISGMAAAGNNQQQKQQRSSSSAKDAATCSPPPSLVAALRQVYEEDEGENPNEKEDGGDQTKNKKKLQKVDTTSHDNTIRFELRRLLQNVSSHSVFQTTAAATTQQQQQQSQSSSSGGSGGGSEPESAEPEAAEDPVEGAVLERLILAVSKLVTSSKSSGGNSTANQHDQHLQGLLIAVLSVLLNNATSRRNQHQAPIGPQQDEKRAAKLPEKSKQERKEEETRHKDHNVADDLPLQSVLQVGSLLSLLPYVEEEEVGREREGEENERDRDNEENNKDEYFNELLEYFGQAAAVYEERLEIQKARMLARLETPTTTEAQAAPPPPPPPAATDGMSTPPPPLTQEEQPPAGPSKQNQQQQERPPPPVQREPEGAVPQDREDEQQQRQQEEENNAVSDDDDDDDDDSDVDDPELAAEDVAGEIDEHGGSSADEDSEADEDEMMASDPERDEEDEEDDEEPYESNSDDAMDDDDDVAEDEHFPHLEEDSSSSSSSSSRSSADVDDDEDEEDAIMDTDDENEAVLRQALALSMAEQEEVMMEVATAAAAMERVRTAGNDAESTPSEEDNASQVIASAETPVSKSTSGGPPSVSEVEDDEYDEEENDDDDATLPSIPKPPRLLRHSQLPFFFRQGSSGPDDPDAQITATPVLDPSELSEFSSLPTCQVLFHLLKYTEQLVELHLSAGASDSKVGPTVVVGGMGTSLFGTARASSQGAESTNSSDKQEVTLQLLVATFLLVAKQRQDAIENLRKALSREQRFAQDGDLDTDDDDAAQEDESPLPSSGEEDDPAMTLAMNYVEDDVPLSSESLENKGMRRKAAAAAHDAAAMSKTLRKRTDAWKNEVRLYSICLACSMKLFRQFLQISVRRLLESCSNDKSALMSPLDFHAHIPSFVVANLTSALESVSTLESHTSCLALLGGEEQQMERIFQSFTLYRESLSLWGECVPILCSTTQARSSLLQKYVDECTRSKDISSTLSVPSIEDLSSFPTMPLVPTIHKFQALCRRLRIKDVLDTFVSKPLAYIPDEGSDEDREGCSPESPLPVSPSLSSSLIAVLGDSLRSLLGDCREAQHLYLALCHRYHTRVLLLDGFYAATEADENSPSVSPVKTLSTGDTVRVSANPSASLQFDSTKCSDSIALLSGFSDPSEASNGYGSAHQRASKVWGAVLSTHQYSPKTGVHRWAVRLDKCERGHVFIGVATAQASTRTYVGGDKFGWGMIGTQALWHDRRKIRGDYGATFRTGSTIIVTLDSDAGTLSFSSWKDGSTSSSLSVDPLVQNILSPRRGGQIGGTIEDWGIAFEGLPLDSKLYPAVGLYQRDDRITLLSVESLGGAGSANAEISGGECYYPRIGPDGEANRIRQFNSLLAWDATQYVKTALRHSVDSLKLIESDEFPEGHLLSSLGASLSLLPPSVPVLSGRWALSLMPHLSRSILDLDSLVKNSDKSQDLFAGGLVEGQWVIRATGSQGSNSSYEEYLVDMKAEKDTGVGNSCFEGSGIGTTGKSKNCKVNIFGCVKGSSVTLVENWSTGGADGANTEDGGSSCAVAARLSVDGRKFEGAYRNVQYGSTGQIVGIAAGKDGSAAIQESPENFQPSFVTHEALLCMAQSHLSILLSDDAAGDLDQPKTSEDDANINVKKATAGKWSELRRAQARTLLSRASLNGTISPTNREVELLSNLYLPQLPSNVPSGDLGLLAKPQEIMKAFSADRIASRSSLSTAIEDVLRLDDALSSTSGGLGSLRNLCPAEYTDARHLLICSILFHCDIAGNLASCSADLNSIPVELLDQLRSVWRSALQILEDGVRCALSKSSCESRREGCSKLCDKYGRVSKFLLSLELTRGSCLSVEDASTEIRHLCELIDDPQSDLDCLMHGMSQATRRGIVRLLSLSEICKLLAVLGSDSIAAKEFLLVGLPRQLGRGKVEPSPVRRMVPGDSPETAIDGTYLHRLSGSNLLVRQILRNQVLGMFQTLGKAASCALSQRERCDSFSAKSCNDSFVLSLLAVFVGNYNTGDIDSFLSESGILNFLPQFLSLHRPAILLGRTREVESDESVANCDSLKEICQRDTSRAVLRCAVAATHVIAFQVARKAPQSSVVAPCLKFLLSELVDTFSVVEQDVVESLSVMSSKQADEDWKRWAHSWNHDKSNDDMPGKPGKGASPGALCIEFLRDHGSMLSSIVQGNFRKPVLTMKASRRTSDVQSRLHSTFAHQFLSHWLHTICAVLRSKSSSAVIAQDYSWLVVLMKGVGLDVDVSAEGDVGAVKLRPNREGVLPARFRSRLLRMLYPLLSTSEPRQTIIHGLLHLAGSSSALVTRSRDEEEGFVSRECLSLLRQLHSPSNEKWRELINRTICEIVSESGTDSDLSMKKVGSLSFFSGSLEMIRRGSFVLLKPAASVAVSPDHQSSSSSKSHSSGIGGSSVSAPSIGATPHHVVGNGTEGVTAGLCLDDAAAGIVSNIDLKNGICEVILVTRNSASGVESTDRLKQMKSAGPSRSSLGGRHILTVRALRTPLADVVPAQEVPIYLDETIPFNEIAENLLESSLDALLSAIANKSRGNADLPLEEKQTEEDSAAGEYEQPVEVATSMALLTLRSSIIIMSDQRMFGSLRRGCLSTEILAKILELAWPGALGGDCDAIELRSVLREGISQLPVHEARLAHLNALLRDLRVRVLAVRKIPKKVLNEKLDAARDLQDKGKEESETTTPQTQRSSTEIGIPPSTEITTNEADTSAASRGEIDISASRSISHSTGETNSDDDDEEESEAAATAAAHLREAAIAQMAELGLPRSWSELALRRTGGINIEAAVTFCLERGQDIERLLAEEQERERLANRDSSGGESPRQRAGGDNSTSNRLLRQLLEMGFPRRWCSEALAVTGNNVDEALTWILNNGERLSEEDKALEAEEDMDNGDEDESLDDEEDDTEIGENTSDGEKDSDTKAAAASEQSATGWSGSIIPLRFISGRAIVDSHRMAISGLPSGGFSSVGSKGILHTTGKWYYEAVLETAGCLQIGWADGSFAGHCHADRGDGCGDGPSSWAFDGWRRYKWHATATEWGCRWKEGDVVGCLVDMDKRSVSFTLNGEGESIGMGVAFTEEGFRPCGGVYACVSFNRREKLRLILGGSGSEPFKFEPPEGYRGVGEAVLEAVKERDDLIEKEGILDALPESGTTQPKRFLCDFSDGEHGHELMAWAHRYYGSDASVHLGSGRTKHHNSKTTSGSFHESSELVSCRLESVWAKQTNEDSSQREEPDKNLVDQMFVGFEQVQCTMSSERSKETAAIAILLARKLLLHLLVSQGRDFDPRIFIVDEKTSFKNILQLWKLIEVCTSLQNAGWIGEASAMAVAAEALGLGISSNDQIQSRSVGDRLGIVSAVDLDEGLVLPTGGFAQVLTSILSPSVDTHAVDTRNLSPAAAEAAMSSDGGGGLLAFLHEGLQGAACRSKEFRAVLVATIRRYVRRLSVVEYDGDDFETEQDDKETNDDVSALSSPQGTERKDVSSDDASSQPDARLVAFLTGLLMSDPVTSSVDDTVELQSDLFEAWSIGLLSASLPWRMICAFSASGILNRYPAALQKALESTPTLARYFGRFQSTVARRIWAERAAIPVCSRYSQALVELLLSVERAVSVIDELPVEFRRFWGTVQVDAATPIPRNPCVQKPSTSRAGFWEWDEGWVSSDAGWEVWMGTAEYLPVEWKAPTASPTRRLMDSGDGPPMLRKGCYVLRGVDWDQAGSGGANGNDDGKDKYDAEKAERDKQKKLQQETSAKEELSGQNEDSGAAGEAKDSSSDPHNPAQDSDTENPAGHEDTVDSCTEADVTSSEQPEESDDKKDKKKKKLPSPKLPLGTVLSVEPWNGVPGLARRVRWSLTGTEGVYRYGGDGGKFDLCHVETNSKGTRVKKRYPLPESMEQCASRHGFGARKKHSIMLRLRKKGEEKTHGEYVHDGIMEWPDFGAGVQVRITRHGDGSATISEEKLLFGSKDSGWEARFGQPSYVPGSVTVLSPTTRPSAEKQAELDIQSSSASQYEELLGSSSYDVTSLRNPENGGKLKVTYEMRLCRGRMVNAPKESSLPAVQPPLPPPITFDVDCHATSLTLSRDGRTVSCTASEGRGTAFASMGFTKGAHYWEVKLEQADIGSVFIGVAEKPIGSGSGSSYSHDAPSRLNRWHGWGFVNFRATYSAGAERVYGSHCHAGDTVGVLLDCDAGRVSFFFDGLKYGEHILNDLGCAFENLSPFGFNVDGCGSGGAGQGAPSGFENGPSGRYPAQGTIRPRTLWPVVGLRNQGDRVTFSSKWTTSYGVDSVASMENIVAVNDVLASYEGSKGGTGLPKTPDFPLWFLEEAFYEFQRWSQDSWTRCATRGSGPYRHALVGLDVDFDKSPLACAAASASLGLPCALLAGDRVRLTRSAGRILELAEEAVVLGAYHGRLYYKIVSQKSEGGSLTEGGGRAWCWDECEVVDDLLFVQPSKGLGVALPRLPRFMCLSPGGLRVVYEHGAVLRSDLEIFDGSVSLGTIPVKTIIAKKDVIDRRVNSCGVIRFRVRYEEIGEGWISARIRGGSEESIVEPVFSTEKDIAEEDSGDQKEERVFDSPLECATAWYDEWRRADKTGPPEASSSVKDRFGVRNLEHFIELLSQAVIPGLSVVQSDSILATALNTISNYSDTGDAVECSFHQVASALSFAFSSVGTGQYPEIAGASAAANQATATVFSGVKEAPSLHGTMARIAMLISFNRRARLALPWLSIRPCQEGSAVFGGLCGHGASCDRAGRSRVLEYQSDWIQVPSVATKIRSLRCLFLTSVKRDFLQSVVEATTTPTPLSHDEYELPREIRTVRINRLKAGRAMLSDDRSAKRKYSVFAQLYGETKNWAGAGLRRGYVAKGHGGQKRAFKVKLVGEGVNDYSGPYREAFTDAFAEALKTDNDGQGVLGVLDRSPNNASSIGDDRDLFIFSLNGRKPNALALNPSPTVLEDRIRQSFASLVAARDEASREVEEALVFLGRLSGTAFRHGIPLDLPLPLESVWKLLAEDATDAAAKLRELDYLAHRQLDSDKDADKSPLVWWQQRMLNSYAEGLSNVLPMEILPLMTGVELRDTLCGNPEVDVMLLRQVVEYEGYEETDKIIGSFWETLHGMTNDERKQFLQFVWARNRLPMRESDFEAPFKIQKDSLNTGDRADQALPSASTCFFSLTLPEYSSTDILRQKLLFAINNVTTMETDFQTNSAEIAEGYRAF